MGKYHLTIELIMRFRTTVGRPAVRSAPTETSQDITRSELERITMAAA